jgi:hypothetical protein
MSKLPCIVKENDTTWCGKPVEKNGFTFKNVKHAMSQSRSNLIDCCPRCANAVIAVRAPFKAP